jgi:hypothetical protein
MNSERSRPRGKMLQLLNPGGKLCYGNAGTNFLLSAPEVTEFLTQQPPGGRLLHIMRCLTMTRPGKVRSRTM